MASQGPRSPTTVSQADLFFRGWNNPSYVTANDGQSAFVGLESGQRSRRLLITGFGFSVPADATIDGILVEVERRSDVAKAVTDHTVQLLKAGAGVGSDKQSSTFWSTSFSYAGYGGATDQWGTTWTASEINDPGFGVQIAAQIGENAATAYIDHVQITIFYTVLEPKAASVTRGLARSVSPALRAQTSRAPSPALGAQIQTRIAIGKAAQASPLLGAAALARPAPVAELDAGLGATAGTGQEAFWSVSLVVLVGGGGRVVPRESAYGDVAATALVEPALALSLEVLRMATLYPGAEVVVTGIFRDQKGRLVDPEFVRFRIKQPDGTITTYSYGTNAELQRASQGTYQLTLELATPGDWYVRAESSGQGQAATEVRIPVETSAFA